MKKHYVYGYSNDKNSVVEKYTAVFLVGMCIAAALITFLVVGISKNINKKDNSEILIDSGVKESVEVVKATGEENLHSREAMSDKTVINNPNTINDTVDIEETEEIKETNQTPEETADSKTYIYPCRGDVIYEFSPSVPIYSATLNDWRVHSGVDFKASLGEEVVAVNDGVVENVYKDIKYGNTIVLLHGDNTKSVYSNLEDSITLKIGDKIEKGSVIARVGDTALFETIADTHLHFEIIADGCYVNPEDYLNLK